MNLEIRMLSDRIAVERLKAKRQTEGGLIIPDNAQERAQEAVVLAVGPGRRDQNGTVWPVAATVGDVVLLGKYTGSEAEIDGHKLLIVREEEILAVRSPRRRAAEEI